MDADRLRISARPKLIRLCAETNKRGAVCTHPLPATVLAGSIDPLCPLSTNFLGIRSCGIRCDCSIYSRLPISGSMP